MNIPQAQVEILRLWEAYQSGQISAQAYTQAVNQLQIVDESGAYWHVDSATQKWYRYNGTAWVETALPAQVAPPSSPPPPPAFAAPQPAPRSRLPLWIGLGLIVIVLVAGVGLLLSGAFKPGAPASQLPTLTQVAGLLPSSTPTSVKPAQATPTPTLPPARQPSPTPVPAGPTATLPAKPTIQPRQPSPTPPSAADFLRAQGPYLLSRDQDNVYLVQANGTAQINTDRVVAPAALADMVAPQGGHIAFVTGDPDGIHNLKLIIYNLAQKKAEKVIALTSDKTEPGSNAMPGDPAFEAVRSITEPPGSSLAWSPDGRTVAFIGVIDGPSSDLYSYNLDTGKLSHLTDGPSQAFAPSWSPDGKYILQFGATGFGTGAGYVMAGAWAARADDSAVISLYKPTGGGESTLGWVDANTVLVYGWSVVCGSSSLRLVTIDPVKVTTLVPGCFTNIAYNPSTRTIAMTIDDITSQGPGQEQKGLYLVSLDGKLQRLSSGDFGVVALLASAGAVWSNDSQGGPVAYTLAGKSLSLPGGVPENPPLAAPGGKVWAWGPGQYDAKPGLWVGAPGNVKQIFKDAVSAAAWTNDAAALIFVSAAKLYFAPASAYQPIAAGSTFTATDLAWAAP